MRSHTLVHTRALASAAGRPQEPHRPEVRPTPPARPARFIGRAAETEAVLQAVREPGSSGAVVVGTAGIGKTALLHHVQRSLTDSYVVCVRGVRSAASSPYRALDVLLSELPGTVAHPALLLPAVARYLREEAGGRRVVVAIDDAEYLDEASSTLVGQLVAGTGASVILTVTDFAQADPAFMGLWRTGSLRRIDLQPLSFEDSVLLVASELRAPVSREGVEALWTVGAGNPRATSAALNEFARRGTLARRGSTWVLLPGPRETGQDVLGTLPSLRTLTRDQRRIVDLVSLAGSLTWSELARLTDPLELDALQDAGVLLVRADPETRVVLAAGLPAEAVAGEVPPEDAARLYRDVQPEPAAARRLAEDPARHVAWLIRAGLPVEAEQAIAAAEALNRDGLHGRCAELVASLGPDLRSARLHLAALVAALGQGHLGEATTVCAVLAAAEAELEPGTWVRYRVQESRLRRLQVSGDAVTPLEEAAERIGSWERQAGSGPGPGRDELAGLRRRVRIARAELASFEGRYRDNLHHLEDVVAADLPATLGREERESLVTLQSLRLEAMVMQDPQGESLRLAEVLARNLSHPGVAQQVADAALMRAEVAFLIAGSWGAGRHVLQTFRRSSAGWSLRKGSIADLRVSLNLIAQDRVRDACAVLEPVVEQLRVTDPHALLPLAGIVLTYCRALTRPADGELAHLPPGARGQAGPWVVRRATQHYQLLSDALTGCRADAARQLQDRAAGDLRCGAHLWALVSLVSALRLGRTEAAEELRALSGTLHFPFAATCLLYARSVLEADVRLTVQAMEAAAASGDYRLAADIARSGSDLALAEDDRAACRVLDRRLRELLPERLRNGRGAEALGRLTAREREIAELAALGRSNRAIAERMYVSVRTVEGHLYQVYSKLSVSTRAELAELLPMATGS